MNKTKTILASTMGLLLIIAGLLAVNHTTPRVQAGDKRRAEAVYVQFRPVSSGVYIPGRGTPTADYVTDFVSRSAGAPVIPIDYPIGQTIADMVEAGYSVNQQGYSTYLFIK